MKKHAILSICLILIVKLGFSQVEIKGSIFDTETNTPVPGANVLITNTTQGTTTNKNGIFILKSENEIKSITISCLGYETQTIENPTNNISIKLKSSVSELGEIVIKGEITTPIKRTSDAIYTGSALTEKGIKLMGSSAKSSVYNAIDLIPGVSVESGDAYGLSDKSVRIRGIQDNFSGMTIDGFPNYGIMPIGARDDIYDMENMQQLAIYKGATPADLGTATGSKGGAIELQYKRPNDEFGVHINQSVGTDNYMRTFARVDLGKLKSNTGIFASGSYTQADKWKGTGLLGPRKNFTMGISQAITKNMDIEIFTNYNQIERHNFKPLTYEQTQDLNNTYNLDYNADLTGVPQDDMNYYDYNGGSFINKDILSTLSYRLSNDQKMSLKYYISSEDADYNEGVKKGPSCFVFNRLRDINRMGFIPEYSGNYKKIKYTTGYWFESTKNSANVYNSVLTNDGIKAVGYSYFTVSDGNGQIHSPYAKVSYSTDKLNFQAGLKYFYYMDPESERYTSVTPTELSETPNANLHTDKMEHQALLPTAGIGYNFSDKINLYFNYGKNYMRPYMYSPIISLYVKNQNTFTNNGMTLQDIFDQWHMETSDNFDLGVRYKTSKIHISPSLFYAKHHNVLASAYDSKVNLDYYQNVGELTAYGADMECYIFPFEKLMLFVNPTYVSMSYDENLIRKTSDSYDAIDIEGNQSPATPKFSLKTGVLYSIKNIDISAKVKYIGERFGDATNLEKIDAYTLVDASIKYNKKNLWKTKELSIGLEFKNILNEKYIGRIDVSDDSVQGSAMYYSGVPFTAVGCLNLKF